MCSCEKQSLNFIWCYKMLYGSLRCQENRIFSQVTKTWSSRDRCHPLWSLNLSFCLNRLKVKKKRKKKKLEALSRRNKIPHSKEGKSSRRLIVAAVKTLVTLMGNKENVKEQFSVCWYCVHVCVCVCMRSLFDKFIARFAFIWRSSKGSQNFLQRAVLECLLAFYSDTLPDKNIKRCDDAL